MSANLTHLPTLQPPLRHEPIWKSESRLLIATTVIAVIGLLNAIGLLILTRRLAGVLSADLPRDAMLLTALVTTATVASARTAWRRSFPLDPTGQDEKPAARRSWDAVVGWGSSLALVLLAVGCCYPANNTSDWLIWLPPLVADQFWRQTFFDAGEPSRQLHNATSEQDEELSAATLAFPVSESAKEAEEIVQQLFRVRDDDGREVVYGTVRADFEAGQRTAVLHVGFCPPLSHIPEIEAESLPGSTARIKVVQALAHGTRMDVRLPAPAAADSHIWIDMAATPAEPSEIPA